MAPEVETGRTRELAGVEVKAGATVTAAQTRTLQTLSPAIFAAKRQAAQGRSLPKFVVEEFEDYLKCGRLEHGFLRVRCETCHHEKFASAARFLQLQASWLLPKLRRPPHRRQCRAPGRCSVAQAAHSPMAAERAVPATLPDCTAHRPSSGKGRLSGP